MAKTGMYVGLDIGTTSVKVVVAEYIDSQMNIIGVGNAKSEGINRGIIVDIDKTVQAIQRAVRQAEEKAGIQTLYERKCSSWNRSICAGTGTWDAVAADTDGGAVQCGTAGKKTTSGI